MKVCDIVSKLDTPDPEGLWMQSEICDIRVYPYEYDKPVNSVRAYVGKDRRSTLIRHFPLDTVFVAMEQPV